MISFPLRLTEELHARIKAAAKRDGRSMNIWIIRLLEREAAEGTAEPQREPAGAHVTKRKRPPTAPSGL